MSVLKEHEYPAEMFHSRKIQRSPRGRIAAEIHVLCQTADHCAYRDKTLAKCDAVNEFWELARQGNVQSFFKQSGGMHLWAAARDGRPPGEFCLGLGCDLKGNLHLVGSLIKVCEVQ